ncbi:MAG TPA: transposase, partial [Aggregatilineales bacterium]|nr:transposase [Aggregatilineales bacterium]
LVSDLDAGYELITLYRQRFAIECLFRDYKSHGWHWEQSQVRDMKHVACLVVAMAFATSLCLLAGTQVAQEWLNKPPSGKRLTLPPEARHSFFQHGLTR